MKVLSHLLPVIALSLSMASCHRPDPAAAAAATAPPPEPAPLDVSTVAATEQPMPRYLRVTGELKGTRQAMVAADASGKVVRASIERGSVVKEGDVLIKLDDRAALLNLQEAEATLKAAQLKLDLQRSELTRNEPLAKTKAISDTDYQKFKIDFASAEASIFAETARCDLARKAVADATILAPFSGTVAERLVEVGEYVGSSTQVVSLVATDTLRLVLNVPETAVGKIKESQQVGFSVPAFGTELFTGTVKYIGASVRESARDLIVEAEVANKDGRLKPGMFAEGRILLGDEPAVAVPSNAVRADGATQKVFIVENGRITERLVEPGESRGEVTGIRRGVSKGEQVIVSPGPEAADGLKVNLTAQR